MKFLNKIFLVVLISIFAFSCAKKKEDKKSEKDGVYSVEVEDIKIGDIFNYIKLSGDVITKINIDALSNVNYGKITQLNVDVGDYVVKNQILAYIDPSLPGQFYQLSPVRSPISGYITNRNGQIGMTVNSQISIYKIGDMSKLQFFTSVPERYIGKIFKDQNADINFEAYSETIFKAKILDISPVLDTTSRTMDVWMNFVTDANKLKPGMFGTVKIFTDKKVGVIKISTDYILTRFEEDFVFTISDELFEIDNPEYNSKSKNIPEKIKVHKAYKKHINIGIRIDGFAEIKSGLKIGDKIVVKGQSLLEDGVYVQLLNEKSSIGDGDVSKADSK